ncbi:hypothetical protein [Nonomuraea gerenzanensis]|uniref:hypothetical protein n=1 Tax=Nonomuraea gerenzanensis TaxID=93944 RepID=UPI001CDA14E6|nr:hypothetical protein [Nonomuraea gerenzanensis]UBU16652.1 hypothetical protein LCN96_17030 [Nonomuraea gerenzanensis]
MAAAVWLIEDSIPKATTSGVLTAVVTYLVLAYFYARVLGGAYERLSQAKEDPAEKLHRRVQAVNQAFAEAATLMDELQRDLEAQQATREALLAEAKHQQRLLELNKDEAENIRQILFGETKKTIRAERRRELVIFLAGVLLSAALSIPIGIWVNNIS